ncbi:MAG: DNA (cytosine-5-)-methyltransferase [Acidobacteria bacterium]|nr:DNA (cytosine-5-)-methyltransferase [Acidobacteriota bacterium]MBI3423127.1 DNA (cytosine-5-)-methyltransferase [Acidobacteriota bacterium]
MMMAEKTFLEFFAGIGLVHLGLRSTGWRCVYANDISEKKQAMYLDEFPDASYFHLEDIWQTENVLELIRQPALLATASFPCVDLSLAGHMRGLKGEHSSSLFGFLEVLRRLKAQNKMPPLVMLENVLGLLTGQQGKDFEETCLALAELGFWIDAFVVDAKHFTSQSRPRLFIVGVLKEAIPPEGITSFHPLWNERVTARSHTCPSRLSTALLKLKLPTGWIAFDLPELPSVQRDLATMIDLDDSQAWWSEAEVVKHFDRMSDLHRLRVEKLMASKQLWVGAMFRRVREGKTKSEVRFDGLAGCLRTAKGGSGKQIVVVIDGGKLMMRWMTPVEYARLQGAPDFNIQRTRNEALTGFADAVCVPVIDWVARHVLAPVAAHLGYQTAQAKHSSREQFQLPFDGLRPAMPVTVAAVPS